MTGRIVCVEGTGQKRQLRGEEHQVPQPCLHSAPPLTPHPAPRTGPGRDPEGRAQRKHLAGRAGPGKGKQHRGGSGREGCQSLRSGQASRPARCRTLALAPAAPGRRSRPPPLNTSPAAPAATS